MITLYRNKKVSWKWIVLRIAVYEKYFFFHMKPVPNNKWLRRPRYFMHINLFFASLWRDNSNFYFGLGFGKRHVVLHFHS